MQQGEENFCSFHKSTRGTARIDEGARHTVNTVSHACATSALAALICNRITILFSRESQESEARHRCSRKDGVCPALDVLQVLATEISGVHRSMQPRLPPVILVAIVLIIQQRLPVRTSCHALQDAGQTWQRLHRSRLACCSLMADSAVTTQQMHLICLALQSCMLQHAVHGASHFLVNACQLRHVSGEGAHSGAASARSLFLAASVSSMLRILYCRDSGTSCMPVSQEDTSCCLIFCPCNAHSSSLCCASP